MSFVLCIQMYYKVLAPKSPLFSKEIQNFKREYRIYKTYLEIIYSYKIWTLWIIFNKTSNTCALMNPFYMRRKCYQKLNNCSGQGLLMITIIDDNSFRNQFKTKLTTHFRPNIENIIEFSSASKRMDFLFSAGGFEFLEVWKDWIVLAIIGGVE